MKNHPLTPMWASDIRELMAQQGKYPCCGISGEVLADEKLCAAAIQACQDKGQRFYLCPDYETDEQGDLVARRFGKLRFLTGGSGLGGALARYYRGDQPADQEKASHAAGFRLLLAGSCSVATRGQVRRYLEQGGAAQMVDPAALAEETQTVEALWRQTHEALEKGDFLLYTSGSGGAQTGSEEDAKRLEDTLAEIARRAVEAGCEKIIVAGGETSGAVTKALGYSLFTIWESVAPGVPVMKPVEMPEISVVLKSGNFGAEDFLADVLRD